MDVHFRKFHLAPSIPAYDPFYTKTLSQGVNQAGQKFFLFFHEDTTEYILRCLLSKETDKVHFTDEEIFVGSWQETEFNKMLKLETTDRKIFSFGIDLAEFFILVPDSAS